MAISPARQAARVAGGQSQMPAPRTRTRPGIFGRMRAFGRRIMNRIRGSGSGSRG